MRQPKRFSPWWLEARWVFVRTLSGVLRPHTATTHWGHEIITALYVRLLRTTEYAEPSLVKELQSIRLQKTKRAAKTIPFWQAYFARAEQQPVDKFSFTGIQPNDLVRKDVNTKGMIFNRTSGTTGSPFMWGYPKETHLVETTAYFYRILDWYGISFARDGQKPFIASFVSAGHATPAYNFTWNPANPLAAEELLKITSKIQDMNLRVLYIYPADLFIFAKMFSQFGKKLPIEIIITTGQALEVPQREYVEGLFRCKVVSVYGSREFGPIAVECPVERTNYHVHAERLIVEVTSDSALPPDEHTGFITITGLENTAMPLLRYNIGDYGTISTEPCPCGRTLPILHFSGRAADVIHLPSGRKLPFLTIVNLLILMQFFQYIEHFQVVQPTLETLLVRIKPKATLPPKFSELVIEKIKPLAHNELEVSVELTDALPVMKNSKATMFVALTNR